MVETKKVAGYVVHSGYVSEGSLTLGDTVELTIEPGPRLSCMRNHTATHLLNSALNSLLAVTAQRSSSLNQNYLRLSFAVFNQNFDASLVAEIERSVLDKINRGIPVKVPSIKCSELEGLSNLISLPGEIYPPQIKATSHGLSAAAGKTGATLGGSCFELLKPGTPAGLKHAMLACSGCSLVGLLVTALLTPRYEASDLERKNPGETVGFVRLRFDRQHEERRALTCHDGLNAQASGSNAQA